MSLSGIKVKVQDGSVLLTAGPKNGPLTLFTKVSNKTKLLELGSNYLLFPPSSIALAMFEFYL
jgi:hypothetical protein